VGVENVAYLVQEPRPAWPRQPNEEKQVRGLIFYRIVKNKATHNYTLASAAAFSAAAFSAAAFSAAAFSAAALSAAAFSSAAFFSAAALASSAA
jgi:hypothetical protein